MELAKRTAHMTAALTGFAKVKPYEQVFPPKVKERIARDIGKFFQRYGSNKKD